MAFSHFSIQNLKTYYYKSLNRKQNTEKIEAKVLARLIYDNIKLEYTK